MALYDLMLILDAEAPDERRTEILDGVRQAIEADGALVESQDWGSRHLAFEIHKREDGAYHLFQLEAAPPLLERLDRMLKITDGVLRYRLIRLKPGQPTPPPPRPDGRRGEDEQGDAASPVAARAAADAPSRR
jgi:small subunit ribosomal protein S6